MSLWNNLLKTYDTQDSLNASAIGVIPLCPAMHILQKAQIEIQITSDGRFIQAYTLNPEEENVKTIIPATPESSGRTSGPKAHPLSDQLQYLSAFDPKYAVRYQQYIDQLEDWVSSEHSNSKAAAVLAYVKSGSIIEDLSKAGIVVLNETASGFAGGKIFGTSYEKCMVRWVVDDGSDTPECWMDKDLQNAWIEYYMNSRGTPIHDICMISGDDCESFSKGPAPNYPKGWVASNYSSKLVSAKNDPYAFTCCGAVFFEPSDAANVGLLPLQKAAAAVAWITNNFSVTMGGRTFVCWNPAGYSIPVPFKSIFTSEENDEAFGTIEDYSVMLRDAIGGYQQSMPANEPVVFASFDALTTGRLAVTGYSEMPSRDFFKHLDEWYMTCCFPLYKRIQSPSLYQIVVRAFGKEFSGTRIEADEAVIAKHYQRLVRCITEGTPIPFDIVRALEIRASSRQSYKNKNNWERVAFTAAAISRKFRNDRMKKEVYALELNPSMDDISYQWGRLLAIYEKIERDAGREMTNAEDLWKAFADRPQNVNRILYEKVMPYFRKISNRSAEYYKFLISQIMAEISKFSERERNERLADTYLIGYFHQRADLYTSKKNKDSEESTENINDNQEEF